MTDDHPLLPRRALIEGSIGIVLLIISFFAIASSDVSALKTRPYWSVLVVVYGVVAFVVDRLYSDHSLRNPRTTVNIVLHWLGVFIAIQLVYFFVSSGRMANADMGLTNGLILALGTFLSGVHGNWRMFVTGLALGLATAGVAFVEEYLWFLAGVAVLALVAITFGSRLFKGRNQ
jgi:hypothetical protein